MYPSFEQIEALHRKYAPDEHAYELVFTHSLIVRDIARSIIEKNALTDNIDNDLVEAGALLHDIGTYSLYRDGKFDKKNYISHGVRGYEILKKEGFPEQLCRIASNHTGMGITREAIRALHLPMPEQDYVANSLEEKLVMYADKFHSKAPRFNTVESYRRFTSQFGDKGVELFNARIEEFGVPDLDYFAKKYGHPLV